jgi:hypothetical protein
VGGWVDDVPVKRPFSYFIPYFQEFVKAINKDIKGTVRQEQNLCLKLLEGACSAG